MSKPSEENLPPKLEQVRRLAAIAQVGLTYARDSFDVERYTEVREIAAALLAELSGQPRITMLDLLAVDSGYATPKVDIRGVVFRGEELLLVRERSDGCWTLPGGWADVGSSPAETVVREIREESGYETRAVKLLAVLDRDRHGHPPLAHHIYKMFFLCELTGGTATTSVETDEIGFFAEDKIPPLSLTRVVPAQIEYLFRHRHDMACPDAIRLIASRLMGAWNRRSAL